MPFQGYKTYVAAILIGAGAILTAFGHNQYTEILYAIGAALGITGLRSKMERDKPGS